MVVCDEMWVSCGSGSVSLAPTLTDTTGTNNAHEYFQQTDLKLPPFTTTTGAAAGGGRGANCPCKCLGTGRSGAGVRVGASPRGTQREWTLEPAANGHCTVDAYRWFRARKASSESIAWSLLENKEELR